MNRLFSIIRKNLKLLIRAKSSALIVVLGPLLLIFLVGIAFDNTQAYQVTIGTYSEAYNDLAESFIITLQQNQFRVVKYQTENDCVQAIKSGNVHTCMVFPAGLQVGKEGSNQITFHIDYSRINLVWSILDTVSGQVTQRSSEISLNLTNTVLNALLQVRDRAVKTKPILVDSTTKNTDISNSMLTISKNLAALDLTLNPSEFHVQEARQYSQEAQAGAQDLIKNSAVYFSKINSEVDEAIAAVTASSEILPEDKTAILSSLLDAQNTTSALKTLVNRQNDVAKENIAQVSSVLDEIESKVNSAKSKFDKVSAFRKDSTDQLSEVDRLLTSALNNIVVIQKNMNFIESTIDAIEFKEATDIVAPITTQIKPVLSEKTHLNYLFPSLIVLVVMFICILLSSILVIMEKNSKAHFRNFLTPTPDIVFVVATYLTTMLLLIVQLIIIIGATALFFKAQVFGNLWMSILVLLLVGTAFSLIGMFIGYLFNSEETATLASISLGTIFLLISGLVLPMESMPDYVRSAAEYNPFVISEGILRKAMLFSANIADVDIAIYTLLGYSLAIFYIIYLMQKLSKKRLLRVLFKIRESPREK